MWRAGACTRGDIGEGDYKGRMATVELLSKSGQGMRHVLVRGAGQGKRTSEGEDDCLRRFQGGTRDKDGKGECRGHERAEGCGGLREEENRTVSEVG